jgi:hypothetical protein
MESQDNGVRWNPLRLVALAVRPPVSGFCWLPGCLNGAACGNRTRDLLITSETLYQLS